MSAIKYFQTTNHIHNFFSFNNAQNNHTGNITTCFIRAKNQDKAIQNINSKLTFQ